ncbi:MAG TPA: DNA repair protein RecN, partial [Geminicoccaceae bacterium]|nr:DNA repair protein RecN [Geminicoccaceae bacterium]
MLVSVAIRDIVLIERLELAFGPGLSVLTGETGAGKSIVLDALGLALGARGDRALVRSGAEQGAVTAEFHLPADHPAGALLEAQGLGSADELVLRRTLASDGRTRAFVNDQAVGTGLLRQLGDLLVEVHGQFEQQSLTSAASHRRLLDAFGGAGDTLARTRAAFAAWREARERAARLGQEIEAARREIDWLRHREHELADLAAQPGEEAELAERRTRLMHREKLALLVQEATAALAGAGGAIERLSTAERRIERSRDLASELLDPAGAALGRALVEAGEAEAALERAALALADGGDGIERVEERLFALRAAARKHRVPVDELPALLEATRAQLHSVDVAADELAAAERMVGEAEAAFLAAAEALSRARAAAAADLARAVTAELPPLKLERARFRVGLEPLAPDEWGPEGRERVMFEVATNPGQPFGPLTRLASGGELSRFMLALKVVLARLDPTGTLVFDEVDAGIGGATAAAVGERLARLGRERQVLVVTHAPQVAAVADRHFRVAKRLEGTRTAVEVQALREDERQDEIARMLAGAAVTDAARAAAASL